MRRLTVACLASVLLSSCKAQGEGKLTSKPEASSPAPRSSDPSAKDYAGPALPKAKLVLHAAQSVRLRFIDIAGAPVAGAEVYVDDGDPETATLASPLAKADGGITLTDLAHRVSLPPSTTHRLLSTLEKMGFVYQAADLGLWYVGLHAFTVGAGFLANRDFVGESHAYMRRLMEQSGETANLAILDGAEAVFIAQVQCHEMMRILVKIGGRVPLHASGVGKALFAALPDEQIDAILKVKGLPRITPHTIVASETMWAARDTYRNTSALAS